MLNLYGATLSSPTNKVRYLANYLQIPYQFHPINLVAAQHRSTQYLKINPYGKVPAIEMDGFVLAESNAIIRYLANLHQAAVYPLDLQARAIVDQWLDYIATHLGLASAKMMFHSHFHKFFNVEKDEHVLDESRKNLLDALSIVEVQLNRTLYLTSSVLSLADFALIAALDTAELIQVNLTDYPHIDVWRKKLMQENFYRQCHASFSSTFSTFLNQVTA